MRHPNSRSVLRSPNGFTARLVEGSATRDWVVMLPGAGSTTSTWLHQLADFTEQYNLALIDLPGHCEPRGPSSQRTDRPLSGYSYESLVDELAEFVRTGLGIGRCHVVALSLGTILARLWAQRRPDQILSLVLVGTIAEFSPFARLLLVLARVVKPFVPYMLLYASYAAIIMPRTRERSIRALFIDDARKVGQAEFNRWFRLTGETLETLRTLADNCDAVPTLHIIGERDHLFGPGTGRLARRSVHSEARVLVNVGHASHLEAPGAFNPAALGFMLRHGISRGFPVGGSVHPASVHPG